jgi:DNA-binding PadR family transcriptional regulator
MPLSVSAALVLQAIATGHRFGFDIMRGTGLPSGTVYPVLRRFQHQGLILGRWEKDATARDQGRPTRRYYELTARGVEALVEAEQRYRALAAQPAQAKP